MSILLDCGATIAEAGDLPGSLIVLPRQIEFNGLLMGSGTPYRWKNLTGWDAMPGLDLSDAQKDTGDGDFPGPGFSQSRMVTFEMQVRGDHKGFMEQVVQLLRERLRYSDTEQELWVRDSGRTLIADARVIARDIGHAPERSLGVMAAGVQWKQTNPLHRAPGERSAHLAATDGSGGIVYPIVYPIDYGIEGGPGQEVLLNAGTDPAPAIIVFHGPAVDGYGVTIAGQMLRFTGPLAIGDTLTVDTRDGSVLLNGSSDRTGWVSTDSVPPETWRIPPGEAACTFSLAAGGGVGTGVDLTWFDSYM